MIVFFDLEGPLCPIDHAADVIELIGKKLGKEEDFYKLFQMISLYDDELFLVDKKPNYWPGDTLKLIAPLVVTYSDEEELIAISEKAKLTPGAKELFDFLHEKEIPTYIISTSYTQHAHTIAKKLHHPIENVRCTTLNFDLLPEDSSVLSQLIEEIFPKFLENGLKDVKDDLDKYFFETIPKSSFGPLFQATIVCGGDRKRMNVKEILAQNEYSPKEAIAVGDSITDIQMLEFINENGGIAVSFNGNEFSLKPANISFSSPSLLPLKGLIESLPESKGYIERFNHLASKDGEGFFHLLKNVSPKEFEVILSLQKKYRKALREKAARLT